MHARAKVAAVAFGAMLSLSACSMAASITTSNEYDPADGTGTTVGSISTENFLLVGTAADAPAALVGTLYNAGDADQQVRITVGTDADVVTVASHGSLTFGFGDGEEQFVTTAPAAPGLIAQVTIEPQGVAAQSKPLPVVDGTFEQYQGVLDALQASEG